MSSKVFFTDFHVTPGTTILKRFEKLLRTSDLKDIDFKGKLVAVKTHFGEYGNLAYLRPNYARILCDYIKEMGGVPFLTDCNTLYVGSRKNAVEHIDTAYRNGFSPLATGCQVVIADGLRGLDEVLIPVDGDYVHSAKIGAAIAQADVFISLSHFKGHESTGFGGALKNIGMGSGSRAGKMEMHTEGKPQVDQDKCIGCGSCIEICAHDGPSITDGKAAIDHNKCVGCGRCIGACPVDAVYETDYNSNDILNKKIAEYSKAVLKGKPHYHISVVCDVSPYCDCHSDNDLPIIPNVGMFASGDPVAIDVACADACNKMPRIGYHCEGHGELFSDVNKGTNWMVCIEHAEKLGLGTREYTLIETK